MGLTGFDRTADRVRLGLSGREKETMGRLVTGLAAMAALMASASAGAAVIHGPESAGEAVLAAEHAFALKVADEGLAAGFGAYLDPVDGLSFGGGPPTRGAAAIAKVERANGNTHGLSWEPDEIFVSTGSDMAVSWGRYTYRPADPKEKAATGRYVTVWRKDKNGDWKGLIDIGSPD